MITLAVVSLRRLAPSIARARGEAFQARFVPRSSTRCGSYEQCVAASKGKDKCAAEMRQLDDAHDDFEDAVNDYKQACP